MSFSSKRRRPNHLAIDPNSSSAAAGEPVSILKTRQPVPRTPPNPRVPGGAARSRANPPVSRTKTKAPPSPIRMQSADDYPVEPPAFPTAPHPFDADFEAEGASMSSREIQFVPPRHSHDLSLPNSQPTRDSLMANMLLSLDQLTILGQAESTHMTLFDEPRGGYSSSYGPGPPVADDRTWGRSSKSTRPPLSSNYGQSHSYSYSSDLEVGDDAARITRGRRSNSSSNYHQTGPPGRINSMRESVMGRQPSTSPRRLHTTGGKGSKSSSSNSIDAGYAQVLGSQRWAQGFGGRSSSFDYGSRANSIQRPWQAEFSESFLNDDYDAAPTPTVHGGPRRTAPPTPVTPMFNNPEPLPEVRVPTLDRKRSTRSARSLASAWKSESKFNLHSKETIPPLPSFDGLDMDSAPAPRVGYEKTKMAPAGIASPATSTAQAAATPQPKQGFFRRVFGSRSASNTTHNAEAQPSPSQFSSHSNHSSERSGSKPQSESQSTPPSREAPPLPANPLQKKSSSFFRRRKKSTVEPDAPPIPNRDAPPLPPHPAAFPMGLEPNAEALLSAGAEPSPASSLRKVMSPYLRGTPTMSAGHSPSPLADVGTTATDHIEGYKRDFSPDYEPNPKASIRPVTTSMSTSSRARRGPSRPGTPPRDSLDIRESPDTRNNSFLDLDPLSDFEHDMSASSEDEKIVGRSGTMVSSASVPRKKAIDVTKSAHPASSPAARSAVESGDAFNRLGVHDASELRDDTFRPIRRHIRAALDSTDSDEDGHPGALALPIEGARSTSGMSTSPASKSKPIGASAPRVRPETAPAPMPQIVTTTEHMDTTPIDEPNFVVGDPTDDDRQKAQRIFDGNEDFIQKDKAAAWMGAEGPVRKRTLRAYMELHDFSGLGILKSLREVCGRLVLRGETQQVDRIIAAFSTRWADCNPRHGFKSTDTIHMICYSIILLNTDLHMADIEQKMTRGQFVRNTLSTIVQAAEDSFPEETGPEDTRRSSILPSKGSTLAVDEARPLADQPKAPNRYSLMPPGRADTNASDGCPTDCGPLVEAPFEGSLKAWEGQVEVVLKNIYASIREERLPLFGAEPERYQSGPSSQSNLSVMGMLKRTPSVLSKAPSEGQSSIRGRVAEAPRSNAARWTSKSRSRHRLGGNGFSSSRTSFDDGNSMWSPSGSSATWSRQSLGRTHTTMSMDSFGSSWPRDQYHQSIGFANALSQAIIREDVPSGMAPSIMSEDGNVAPQLLEDESLELAGPPWVKEAIVTHKHHLDGIERKAKDRNWTEVFAVIQKGTLSLFSFSPNKSLRHKARAPRQKDGQAAAPIQVGGGNWQENATCLGTFNLRQSLASALPPPGYSRSRPHVWALSLPTGAVHLFQVGTPEIINEFVNTSNYWSARLSTHPLVGGISNVEYGWGESVVNNSIVAAVNESTATLSSSLQGRASRPGSAAASGHTRRGSTQSGRSFRSGSFDYGSGGPGGSGGRHKLPNDRIHIAEWVPPAQSMRPGNLAEEEQLKVLEAYVKGIEEELQGHNQLRSPMLVAFTPRGHNAVKAMANWERKSAYLLREIVKFRTYVDCLKQADAKKREIYEERAERLEEAEMDAEAVVEAET